MDTSRLGSAREEAERLVVTGLAVASTALRGMEANRQLRGLAEQVLGSDRMHDLAAGLAGFVNGLGGNDGLGRNDDDAPAGGPPAGASEPAAGPSSQRPAGPAGGWSTGSADCCVCPVCRLIAALRDPSPEFAERLASAAGDLAVGISGLLRALSDAVPTPGHHAEHGPWRSGADDPWRAATRATGSARGGPTGAAAPVAEDLVGDPTAPEGTAYSTPTMAAEAPAPASKPAAKKTAAKKATAKKATVGKATATEPVARKAAAKKAVAKKAVRKAVPRDPGDGPQNR